MNWFKIENKADDVLSIAINEEIGAFGITSKDFIERVESAGSKKIKLVIDSPGGSVFDAFAIYDFLTTSNKYETTVEIRGMAASAASILALAGKELPTMTENSFIMIHNPFLTIVDMDYFDAEKLRDKAAEALSAAELLDTVKDKLINIYSKRTGLNRDELSAMLDAETWITSEEALEMGFISSITEPIAIAAKADPEKLKNLGIMNAPKQFINNKNQNKMEIKDLFEDLKSFISNKFPSKKEEGSEVKEVKILDHAEVSAKIAELESAIEAKASEIEAKQAEIEASASKVAELEANATELADEIARLKGEPAKPEEKADENPVKDAEPNAAEKFGQSVLANLIKKRYDK